MSRWLAVLALVMVLPVAFSGCEADCPTGGVGPIGPGGDPGPEGPEGPKGTDGVAAGTLELTVTDSGGTAIKGASIVTVPQTKAGATDDQGKATLSDLPVGSYDIVATAPGFQAACEENMAVQGGVTTPVALTLAAGAEFELAQIVGIPRGYVDELPAGEIRATLDKANEVSILPSGLGIVPVGAFVYFKAGKTDAKGDDITGYTWTVKGPHGSKATFEYWDGKTVTTGTVRTWTATGDHPDARLRPDAKGMYEIRTEATTAGGSSSSTLTFYADRFVGGAACTGCHAVEAIVGKGNAVYADWKGTGHAKAFEDVMEGLGWLGTRTADNCEPCHVTGHDESSDAGGFDDMAVMAGWDPSVESLGLWFAPKEPMGTPGVKRWADWLSFLNDPTTQPMQRMMDVQCEACHGPGTIHPGPGMRVEYTGAVCGQCHGMGEQTAVTAHAEPLHRTIMGNSARGRCLVCHSAQGFIAKLKGGDVVDPDEAYPGRPATVFGTNGQHGGLILGCPTCHNPHKNSSFYTNFRGDVLSAQLWIEDGEVKTGTGVTAKDLHESTMCVMCHNLYDPTFKANFLAGKESRPMHRSVQVDMLNAKSGAEYTGKTYSVSKCAKATNGRCVKCHMYVAGAGGTGPGGGCFNDGQCPTHMMCEPSVKTCYSWKVGGHTLDMRWTDTSATPPQEVEHTPACNVAGCHDATPLTTLDTTAGWDIDGDGTVEGVQTEIGDLLQDLAAELPKNPDGKGVLRQDIDKANLDAKKLQALYNYFFVDYDASHGLHNPRYAAELLCDSLKDIKPAASCNRAPAAP